MWFDRAYRSVARRMFMRLRAADLIFAVVAAVPVCVSAEETTRSGARLQFSATAYLWASGLHGEQALFGLPAVDVDLAFRDVLDKVDVAVAGVVQVQGDLFGFLGEANYVKLGADATAGVLSGGFETKAFFALAAGTWRATRENWGTVDLVAGAKYFSFKNSVQLSPGPFAASDSADFVDATVGAKAAIQLSPKWTFLTWALIGGGGSDRSWDLLAAFDYQFNDRWSASFGYRAMGVDYSAGGFSYDMTQRGPILGITARF